MIISPCRSIELSLALYLLEWRGGRQWIAGWRRIEEEDKTYGCSGSERTLLQTLCCGSPFYSEGFIHPTSTRFIPQKKKLPIPPHRPSPQLNPPSLPFPLLHLSEETHFQMHKMAGMFNKPGRPWRNRVARFEDLPPLPHQNLPELCCILFVQTAEYEAITLF